MAYKIKTSSKRNWTAKILLNYQKRNKAKSFKAKCLCVSFDYTVLCELILRVFVWYTIDANHALCAYKDSDILLKV